VTKDNQTVGRTTSAAATARAIDGKALENQLLNAGDDPEQCCAELSRIFGVQPDEIGLLHLEDGLLRFLFPRELASGGPIPLSSSAVAAQTAVARKAVLFNTFTKVKHASSFESIVLNSENREEPRPTTIHKLMSAPVVDKGEKVLGVLQISRKGLDPNSAGPDFTQDDLQKLEFVTKALAQLGFMRQG